MDTMVSRPPDVPPAACAAGRVRAARPACRPASVAVAAVSAAAACACAPAAAETWQAEATLGSQLLWTNNSDIGSTDGKSDTSLQVRPRVSLRGEGARLSVSGSAGLNAIAYANRTQDSRVQPEADLTARLAAVERLFFVEAGYRATQTSVDPFAARTEGTSTANSQTATQARLSPYIEAKAGSGLSYRLRSDNTWTRQIGGPDGVDTARGYFARHFGSIEQEPTPLGWRIDGERSVTRYAGDTTLSPTIDLARLVVNYAPGADLRVGVRAGYESNNLSVGVKRRNFSGVEARWDPSPRTSLTASRENRFFGTAWQLDFNHRMPQLAWSFGFGRNLDTTPQSLFELPATDNVAGLLDAMFTTRYPDPVERARVVQDFINSRGLPTATLAPIGLLSERLSIVTQRTASVALIGKRNTLALSAYHVQTEDAFDGGPLATGSSAGNNLQYGAGLSFTHRLSTLVSLNASLDWSRIRALADVGSEETRQRGAKMQVNLQAAPKTSAYFGGRYRRLDSNVVQTGEESEVFVGMDHRF